MYFLLKKKVQDIIFVKKYKNNIFYIPPLIGFYLKKVLA